MSQRIKISVVIPTYNRSRTIEYCLKSILNQTYPPFEVLVVDDCSTDNTVETVNNYPDSRVKCIVLDKNSGAQVARNQGIKEAKSDWIAFQDSDDEWLIDKLAKQVEELKKVNFDPFTVVHGNCFIFKVAENEKSIWNLPVIEGRNSYFKLLSSPSPMFQAILTSKKALEKINYLDEHVPSFQEWDTSILLSKYCQFIHIKEPLFIYYLHQNETISKNYRRHIEGYAYIIIKHKEAIISIRGNEVWHEHIHKQLTFALEHEFWDKAEFYLSEYKIVMQTIYYNHKFHIKNKIKPELSLQNLTWYQRMIIFMVKNGFIKTVQKILTKI